MRKFTRRTSALSGGIALLTVTGVAFAAWTSSGSGSGTAQSTTSANSNITAATFAADLYPGATKSITVTMTNPNDYPVVVTSISAGSSLLLNTTCAAASVTSDARTLDNSGLVQSDNTTKTIAAQGSATYTLVTHMIADPDNACKSQSFPLALTAILRSNA
jgi:hypothetical protein